MSERPKPRALPLAAHGKLDGPSIMHRALAAAHGARYVQLAAFAIDVDRVYTAAEDDDALPFGWEVFLVEEHLLGSVPGNEPSALLLLEETCTSILAQPPEEQGYGSQLVFAVHDALRRGRYPAALSHVFASWRGAPRQLTRALDTLFEQRVTALPLLARHCLAHAPEPGLAPPTREALQAMAEGTWPPSSRLPTEPD